MKLVVDDHSVFCSTAGQKLDSSRDSVVFLHGAGQDHSIWVLASRYFARHKRNVLSIDLPGHGRSGGEPLSSIEEMADWLHRFLSVAGISNVALVGHSMGSLVALANAARYPNQVTSMALVGTAVPMAVSDSLLTLSKANDGTAVDMLTLWGHSSRAHLGGAATPGLWMLNCGARLMQSSNPDVLFADLSACKNYTSGLSDAEAVQCPVALVLGQRDLLTPVRSTKQLSNSLADATTIVLPNAGHALLSECPDQVLDALLTVV